jgi:hypothetical protein
LLALAAVAVTASLQDCVNMPITEQNASDIYDKFAAGQIRLSTSLFVVGNNIWLADKMYEAASQGDWALLSKISIQSNSGDDIGYFYLGLAAEGLGLNEAARVYYRLSIYDSLRGQPPPQCTLGPGASYLGRSCHGLVLPHDAQIRLRTLSGPTLSSGPTSAL